MNVRTIALMIIAFFILASCASIVSKSSREVTIRSSPEQADVIITDEKGMKIHQAKTPCTITLATGGGYFQGKQYTVRVSKEGFDEQTVVIGKSLNPWYLGNVIFGGLIGILIVDPATGCMWKLDTDQVNVSLSPKKTLKLDKDYLNLTIVLLEDVPDHLRAKMVRIK
ncbi:MAG: PEGA domain-containing protein [Nitrospirota bacterium]